MSLKDKATYDGSLTFIEDCYLRIPSDDGRDSNLITMNNLPEISDTKTAVYNNEAIIGRSVPLYTYSHSGDRQISLQMHFFVVDPEDIQVNLNHLNWIRSAVYPRQSSEGLPFKPPTICKLKCGLLLDEEELCVILQSYSVKFPTDVAWDTETFVPFRFDVDTSFLVVHSSENLPYQKDIQGRTDVTSRIVQSRR